MDMMASDRKVWTAVETRALISLKDEMKHKFLTMKRNRTLWVELSGRLRKHYGHERTPAQCAVRWKNILSAYKESREVLQNPRPDGKVCSFFKEVEAVVGDPPLVLSAVSMPERHAVTSDSTVIQARKREEEEDRYGGHNEGIVEVLKDLSAKIEAQGVALKRLEMLMTKLVGGTENGGVRRGIKESVPELVSNGVQVRALDVGETDLRAGWTRLHGKHGRKAERGPVVECNVTGRAERKVPVIEQETAMHTVTETSSLQPAVKRKRVELMFSSTSPPTPP